MQEQFKQKIDELEQQKNVEGIEKVVESARVFGMEDVVNYANEAIAKLQGKKEEAIEIPPYKAAEMQEYGGDQQEIQPELDALSQEADQVTASAEAQIQQVQGMESNTQDTAVEQSPAEDIAEQGEIATPEETPETPAEVEEGNDNEETPSEQEEAVIGQESNKNSETIKQELDTMITDVFANVTDDELRYIVNPGGKLADWAVNNMVEGIKRDLAEDPSKIKWEYIAHRSEQLGQKELFDAYEAKQKDLFEKINNERSQESK